MGVLSWFRRKRPLEAKPSAAGSAISAWTVGHPVWTPRDYSAFAEEGYRRNAITFRCVKMIAGGAATVPWLLYGRDGGEIGSHPILDLLADPNPMASGGAFFEAVYAYLLIAGNSYLERVGPDRGPPRELWALRPDRTRVIAGSQGIPQGYEYEAYGRLARWQADPRTGDGPILHLREFNPLDDWYGLSRLEAAAYGVDRHNAASAHNKALLDNGARPSGALIYEPVRTGPETWAFAPKEEIDAAEARLGSNNVGPVNAGRPLVLGGNIKWEEMGISPKDMDFGAGKDDAARDICAAFGIPHILVVPGASTYNNVREAKLELWEDTILPLVDRVVDGLNTWLCPLFGGGLRLGVDLDEISALEPRRESKRKTVIDLLEKGVIDHEEARAALQYGPLPEMVRDPDAGTITALQGAVETVGMGPLARYLRSVGLIAKGVTDDEVLRAATAYLDEVEPTEHDDASAVTPPVEGENDHEGDDGA